MFLLVMFIAASILSFADPASPALVADATVFASTPGGPPSIRLARKAKGDISAAAWKGVCDVDLVGCVADARITALTICIKDCKGKDAAATGRRAMLTKEMHAMVRNLPAGTPFTVKVEVRDGKGTEWNVPDAMFMWKG